MSNRPNLAQLLIESARKAEQERDLNNQVARIAAIVTPKIIAAEKAETSKPMSCPHCGEPLPESWRTDDVTGVSDDNDDDVNEQDDTDHDDDDNDRELDAKAKSRIVAELLARKRRR
jgi:hypothetical protein